MLVNMREVMEDGSVGDLVPFLAYGGLSFSLSLGLSTHRGWFVQFQKNGSRLEFGEIQVRNG
jgi:hypothetical protein